MRKNFEHNFIFICIATSLLACSCYEKQDKTALKDACSAVCKIKVAHNDGISFGTGFLVRDSLVLTNSHLFNKTNIQSISVQFYDDDDFENIEIAYKRDEKYDLASFTYANYKNIRPINISTKSISTGDTVYSIGYQNGINLSITKGNISNPDVVVNYNHNYSSYIESNIDIYPGCSGAPLLNSKFECIGINTFGMNNKENEFIKAFGYSINANVICEFLTK